LDKRVGYLGQVPAGVWPNSTVDASGIP
jgi:hypothetical protein